MDVVELAAALDVLGLSDELLGSAVLVDAGPPPDTTARSRHPIVLAIIQVDAILARNIGASLADGRRPREAARGRWRASCVPLQARNGSQG